MLKRTIITISCLLIVYIIGLFTIPLGRVNTFLYEFDSDNRARQYKMYDGFDIANKKCQHLDMTEAGDQCWDTAYNEFMAK